MPLAINDALRLDDREAAFVFEVGRGTDLGEAAIKSGYNSNDASGTAKRLLRKPAILAAVHIEVGRQLATAAPVALRLLHDTVTDISADRRLRVVCAKTILDRAGHIAPKAAAPGAAGVLPLNEMSMDDLRALADKLEGELAGRAKEVSSATPAPRKAQTIEDII